MRDHRMQQRLSSSLCFIFYLALCQICLSPPLVVIGRLLVLHSVRTLSKFKLSV